eukprot:245980-Rhodomonas_salina.1
MGQFSWWARYDGRFSGTSREVLAEKALEDCDGLTNASRSAADTARRDKGATGCVGGRPCRGVVDNAQRSCLHDLVQPLLCVASQHAGPKRIPHSAALRYRMGSRV